MRARLTPPLLALALLAAPGCSSALMTPFDPEPYVGARTEVSVLRSGETGFVKALVLLDLPLSFLLDTALVPYTLTARLLSSEPLFDNPYRYATP